MFRPGENARAHSLERLSDGLRSLFYFSLVAARCAIEQAARAAAGASGKTPALEFDDSALPALTVFAVEEPENHLAPHTSDGFSRCCTTSPGGRMRRCF
jgi:hypothetical protein